MIANIILALKKNLIKIDSKEDTSSVSKDQLSLKSSRSNQRRHTGKYKLF